MSNDNEALGKALLEATLKALTAKVKSGEATAADLNVALQAVKALGIEMIPTRGKRPNAAGQLVEAITDKLPFTSTDQTH